MAEGFEAGQPGAGDSWALPAECTAGPSYEVEGFDPIACVCLELDGGPGLTVGEQRAAG
ncbi:hypothetical protein [Streptomyces sp. CoH27]|uniref:hypothetical protein n=1 Tax=Streptomyces sp. CoH27 TaxID=2875763 RepID=UPI001CD764CA|nr:hypothetical protein [Streptomyces sp. CoH27]